MKIGLTLNDLATVRDDAERAESLGFDYVAAGEHLFFHGPTPNAFVMLAAAAGATERIRLLSAITLLPLYPAALAAKMASALDVVSDGRFDLGIGAGGEFPPEFEAVGVDPDTRFRRIDEAISLMRRLFTGESVDFSGEFTRLAARLQPPPVQPGGPPIWLAGRKPGGIRRAARFADVWMPYMVSVPSFQTGYEQVTVAAAEAGRDPSSIAGAVYAFVCVDPDRGWAREQGIAKVSAAYRQDFTPLADKYLLLGTPEDVIERVEEYRAAGADRMILNIAAEPAHQRRVTETLATKVLPQLRR